MMIFDKKLLAVAMLSVLALSGCGYQLRGTASSPSTNIASGYQLVNLTLDNNRTAFDLKQPLSNKLALLGVQTGTSAHNHIQVSNLNFRRYELIGVLTEVRLVLSADVSYQLGEHHQKSTLQVERSYQFNEAGVATIDQQSSQVQGWLYEALASRISEQYYALSQGSKINTQ